jgi:hypothetical protein
VRHIWKTALTIGAIATLALPLSAAQLAADLSTWTASSQPVPGAAGAAPGEWVPNADGTIVMQTVNGAPTFLASPFDVEGHRLTATFETPTFDDDFLGIAIGFSNAPGDPGTDYLLIDWKQTDQDIDWLDGTGPVMGEAGLAVSRVVGSPTLNEFWGHIDSPANLSGGVTELARGSTLGSTGWVDGTSYDFVVEYRTTQLDVWVDGSHEISISGSFPGGPMALYDFSQPGLAVAGVTTELLNQPPEVIGSGAADVIVNEGQTGSTSGGFVDPDGHPITLSCSGGCSGFVDNGDGTWAWSQLLPEGPGGFSVTVSASDGELSATDTFDVVVNNLPPVITSTSGVPGASPLSSSLSVSAIFTDPGVLDTHTAVFAWGDGTTSAGTVNETAGSGSAAASHQYSAPGFYTITVTVTDDDGASDSSTLGEVFIFDPDTFVTGGGWITSPTGAVGGLPGHTGKATFGFVAKYDKSGTVKGNLEFQLHKGWDLHATTFDYLLVNSGIAVFEGTGKVNGVPGYDFKVVATDERYATSSQDLFWITVSHGGSVVYDGDSYPVSGLPITGKGIQVHKK